MNKADTSPKKTETLTVKALAKASGVSADTIRHYSQIGLLHPNRDPGNGYRYFSGRDIRTVRFVKQAKMLGYTLSEIIKIIELSAAGSTPCPLVRDIIQRRIRENRERINDMTNMQRRMEQALSKWSQLPDGTPDGHQICHLIEISD